MSAGYVDVLIITHLTEELDGVLALGDGGEAGWTRTKASDGSTYHIREFQNARGKPFTIAAAWAGPIDVADRVEPLIEELSPSWIATCGVCEGFSDDGALGDLLFVEGIVDYRPVQAGQSANMKLDTYRMPTSLVVDAPMTLASFRLSDAVRSSRPKSLQSQEWWLLHTLHATSETDLGPVNHPDRREKCPNWSHVIDRLRRAGELNSDAGRLTLTNSGRQRVEEERIRFPDGLPDDSNGGMRRGWLATTRSGIMDRSELLDLYRRGRAARGRDRRTADFARVAEKLERKLLVVKTIVDFHERDPFPNYVPYGCRASAECLLHVLQHIFTPDERPLPSPPTSRRETFLESISIHNFKNIQRLEFDLLQPSALPGRWTCIAGLNGAGKSAILQAIAIVLLGDKLATELGGSLLARARRMTGDEFHPAEIRAKVRSGQEQIDLFLPLDENGVNERHLEADERSYQKMREFWIGRKRNHLLLAYGAGRNLSEHRDTRHKDKDDETRRQMTLFDPLTQVASVDILLEQGERAKPILAMLKRLLDAILVDVQFSVEESATGLTFRREDAVVPASELPDGFRATIAWLADICATWFKKAPEEAAKDGDPSKIRGIVLIDEIDLHLHASLQRILVPNLRKALPLVQWIVTTHSPLVVSSFDRREIVLLQPGPRGPERKELDRQILGFSSDEVYEYLMAIEPHSAALDDKLASGEGGAELAHILAQSPTVSDEQATEERAHLDDLAKLRDVSLDAEQSKNEG